LSLIFNPARQVAGDFYDAFEMEGGDKIGFVIATGASAGRASTRDFVEKLL